jgi:hypothetical protein
MVTSGCCMTLGKAMFPINIGIALCMFGVPASLTARLPFLLCVDFHFFCPRDVFTLSLPTLLFDQTQARSTMVRNSFCEIQMFTSSELQ